MLDFDSKNAGSSPDGTTFFVLLINLSYLCIMEKEFVTYEQSLELKKIEFDEPCYFAYTKGTRKNLSKPQLFVEPIDFNKDFTFVSAPTFSQVFRWFEEKYSYFVDVKTDTTPNEILGFDYYIKSWKFGPMYFDFFKDKREGNIEVIKKMIEMVKKEKQKEALIELMDNDKDLDK